MQDEITLKNIIKKILNESDSQPIDIDGLDAFDSRFIETEDVDEIQKPLDIRGRKASSFKK